MSIQEKDNFLLIKEAVQSYFDGVIKGEFPNIVKVWHKSGNRILIDPETNQITFQDSPASDQYSSYKPHPQMKQIATTETIDVTGNAASVRLTWQIENPEWKGSCTEYLLLLKEKSKWVIVSKISHKQ